MEAWATQQQQQKNETKVKEEKKMNTKYCHNEYNYIKQK